MGTNECMGECDRCLVTFFFSPLIIYVSNVDVMFVGFKGVFYELCEHC